MTTKTKSTRKSTKSTGNAALEAITQEQTKKAVIASASEAERKLAIARRVDKCKSALEMHLIQGETSNLHHGLAIGRIGFEYLRLRLSQGHVRNEILQHVDFLIREKSSYSFSAVEFIRAARIVERMAIKEETNNLTLSHYAKGFGPLFEVVNLGATNEDYDFLPGYEPQIRELIVDANSKQWSMTACREKINFILKAYHEDKISNGRSEQEKLIEDKREASIKLATIANEKTTTIKQMETTQEKLKENPNDTTLIENLASLETELAQLKKQEDESKKQLQDIQKQDQKIEKDIDASAQTIERINGKPRGQGKNTSTEEQVEQQKKTNEVEPQSGIVLNLDDNNDPVNIAGMLFDILEDKKGIAEEIVVNLLGKMKSRKECTEQFKRGYDAFMLTYSRK